METITQVARAVAPRRHAHPGGTRAGCSRARRGCGDGRGSMAPAAVTVKALLVTMPAAVASNSSSNAIVTDAPSEGTTVVVTAGGVVSTSASVKEMAMVCPDDQLNPDEFQFKVWLSDPVASDRAKDELPAWNVRLSNAVCENAAVMLICRPPPHRPSVAPYSPRRNTTGVERVQRREPRIQRHIGFSGNQVRRRPGGSVKRTPRPRCPLSPY